MTEPSSWRSKQSFYSSNQLTDISEHPLAFRIQDAVNDYRHISPAHSSMCISARPIQLVPSLYEEKLETDLMTVAFENFAESFTLLCRPVFDEDQFMTSEVDVQDPSSGEWVPLNSFLPVIFPVDSAQDVDWIQMWETNGMSFRWSDLPVEIKENIIQYAVCQPQLNADQIAEGRKDSKKTAGSSSYGHGNYHYTRKGRLVRSGLYEILDQLGDWKDLLWTSRQVRTITLRLILQGNKWYEGGLCILGRGSSQNQLHMSHPAYKNALGRLNSFYQIGAYDNSIPIDAVSASEAKVYQTFPRRYPHLSKYATFKHGIRKLYLEFDWKHTLHFWGVSNPIFFPPRRYVGCESFAQLPALDGMWLLLPRQWPYKAHWSRGHWGLFWDSERPCPRMLHRLIYEQAAKTCAHYGVEVYNIGPFMDDEEEARFWVLNEKAIKNLREKQCEMELSILNAKFTPKDLRELYEECGGGVELSDGDSSGAPSAPVENAETDAKFTTIEGLNFPLQCVCDTQCRVAWDWDRMKNMKVDWARFKVRAPFGFRE